MAFLNQLSEKLEAQKIYDGLAGKYETRFVVDGVNYALIAQSIAGDCQDNYQWMLEFENELSHRIGMGDNNPKVAKAFGEAVDQWIKERSPHSFFTFGSHIDSLKAIIENVKKKAKGYNLVDDTADQKNEDTGTVIEGNPVGRILWTKMVPQEAVDTKDREALETDKYEPDYELPKDLKVVDKEFMSGTAKTDKLEKGDKAYDQKFESFAQFKQTLEEGLNADELIKKAKSVMKKFKDKFAEKFQKAIDIASNKEKLEDWLENNKDAFINAVSIVKHMTNPQELKFEGVSYDSKESLNENLLDFIAKKSPKALTAAAIILTLMGSGTKVLGANTKPEDAFDKVKSNVEKMVDAVKEKSGEVKEKAEKGKESVEKGIEKGKETVQKGKEKGKEAVKKGKETFEKGKEAFEKGKETVEKGKEDIKKGFEDFKKEKEKLEPEIKKGIEDVKSGVDTGIEVGKKLFNKAKEKVKSNMPKPEVKPEPRNEIGMDV